MFRIGTKWFWIGVVAALLHPIAGIVYGLGLMFEKTNLKKEGWIIIGIAIAWFAIGFLFLGPWLARTGTLPQFQLVK